MTNTSIQVALPARMSLAENAFDEWEIAVLEFPFTELVNKFRSEIERVYRDKKNNYVSVPYRQLNNALLACAPTLTYGFEYVKKKDNITKYRALAVGTLENPLQTPEPEKIHQLIIIWAKDWADQCRKKGKKEEVDSLCDRFLDDISKIPEKWDWQHIKPETLIKNLNSEEGLGFQAIPSLLATQLHSRNCTIKSADREQKIQWRKVQGNGYGRTGLYLISQPFQGFYVDDNGKEKTGYFAYRLDFNVETQAGRFNTEGNLKPWIFLNLGCQRYAHEPLKEVNYNQDISILVGMNKSRLSGYELDSTLVRLVVNNSGSNDNFDWKYRLPELLADFKARNLEDVSDIFNNPAKYGNLNDTSNWGDKDEYYTVHDEGYRYLNEETQRNKGHSIKTGFSFAERGDITAKVLELLDSVLIADTPLETDIPTPKGQKKPLAMRDYKDIFKSTKKLEFRQKIISDGIQRALKNKPMHIFIICKEKDTHELTYQQLREAFLLADGEDFPSFIKVSQIWIDDYTLLQPLDTEGLRPKDKEKFNKQIKKQHQKKRDAWSNFLQTKILKLIDVDSDCFAIIEIGKTKQKGILPQQNIKGAIREACIKNNIHSQIVQTVKKRGKEKEDGEDYTTAEKARILNSVLDLILRQTATLYGLPSKIYEQAKIPQTVAEELDVIAFCRRRIHQYQGDIHYALAVRLRANGDVDVLFPHASDWIPYTEAEIELGRIFFHARGDKFEGKYRVKSKIKLSNPELMQFVSRVLTKKLEKPTIALIEAEGWRNERASDDKDRMWFQLKNDHLFEKRNILDFGHVAGHSCKYNREDEQLNNLLAVIRIRNGKETPQYITNREKWNEDSLAEDFINLRGFWDKSVPKLLHYFSVGRLPETQKKQREKGSKELYMLDSNKKNEYGFNMAVKHQQMLELVPFFVHHDFQNEEYIKALCRVPHYLRISPSWFMGNISKPLLMHLGNSLIDDCLCIIGLDS